MERTSRRDARARVVGVLAEAGAVSRADLARRAALAPSTVSAVVSELHAAGLVVEPAEPVHPPERGAVGRPPVLIALHRRAGVVAGIDFGKRHVRLAISDLSHALLAERHRALDADLPAKEAIALAAALFDDALEEAEVARDEVVGVGHGPARPGAPPVGRARQLDDPARLGRRRAPRTRSARRSAIPVEVENDANLGALGEWMWGAGRGADHMAYVKASTGIGAGLHRRRRRPYVGAGGTAGELGHTVVDPGGPICRCGNRGCLETYAGAPAILGSLRDVHGDDLTLAGGRRLRRPRRRRLPARDRRRRARRSAPPWPRSATSSTRTGWSSAAISAPPASCCSGRCGSRCVRGAIRSAAEDVDGRPGRAGRPRRGVGRCCARVRKGRRGLNLLTLRYSAMNTSNSQIVASLR